MRYIITTITVLILSLNCNVFSQEGADTIAVLENATDIIVTRLDGMTKVEATIIDEEGVKNPFVYEVNVENNDSVGEIELKDNWILNPPFIRRNTEILNKPNSVRRDVVFFEHLYAGWRFYYHDNSKVKNFFEGGVRQIVGMQWTKGKRNSSTFSLGLGIGWKMLKAQKGFVFGKENDRLTVLPVAESQKVKSSWVTMMSFQVPVLYSQNFAKDYNFSIGGIINLNSYAVGQTEITDGNVKLKTKYNGLQQNFLTPDLYVFLGGADIGVYFTWSPVSIFQKKYGPELKGFTIGIELFSF